MTNNNVNNNNNIIRINAWKIQKAYNKTLTFRVRNSLKQIH